MPRLAVLVLLVSTATSSGCAAIAQAMVDGAVDRACETKEERHVRKDFERHREDEPLKHHSSYKDLKRHARCLEDEDDD